MGLPAIDNPRPRPRKSPRPGPRGWQARRAGRSGARPRRNGPARRPGPSRRARCRRLLRERCDRARRRCASSDRRGDGGGGNRSRDRGARIAGPGCHGGEIETHSRQRPAGKAGPYRVRAARAVLPRIGAAPWPAARPVTAAPPSSSTKTESASSPAASPGSTAGRACLPTPRCACAVPVETLSRAN